MRGLVPYCALTTILQREKRENTPMGPGLTSEAVNTYHIESLEL